MNERIRELRLQATLVETYTSHDGSVHEGKSVDSEKFAELIVRECVEVCRRQQYYDADDEHKRGVNSGSYTCMNAIKQHFGVEE